MKLDKIARYSFLGMAALMIILGAVALLWPAMPLDALSILFGVLMLISAIVRIVNGIKPRVQHLSNRYDIGHGVFQLFVAYLLIGHSAVMAGILSVIAGFVLLMSGIMKMQAGYEMRIQGGKKWIFFLLLAIVNMVFGVILVVSPYGAELIGAYIGAGLILEGIENLVDVLWGMRKAKTANPA